jgi:hypothetical protein
LLQDSGTLVRLERLFVPEWDAISEWELGWRQPAGIDGALNGPIAHVAIPLADLPLPEPALFDVLYVHPHRLRLLPQQSAATGDSLISFIFSVAPQRINGGEGLSLLYGSWSSARRGRAASRSNLLSVRVFDVAFEFSSHVLSGAAQVPDRQ